MRLRWMWLSEQYEDKAYDALIELGEMMPLDRSVESLGLTSKVIGYFHLSKEALIHHYENERKCKFCTHEWCLNKFKEKYNRDFNPIDIDDNADMGVIRTKACRLMNHLHWSEKI